jgi:outer membrane protein OmpA-like peptidoglycan-associated protein
MKNPSKAIGSILVLTLFLGGMFLLPKAVQKGEKFPELVKDISQQMPAPAEAPKQKLVFTPDQPSPATAATPGTGQASPAIAMAEAPKGPDPAALVNAALAAGDPAKAAVYLEKAKDRLDATTYTEMSGLVTAAKDRAAKAAADAAQTAAAAAKMAAAAAAPAVDTAANKALIDSQALLANTLKELQKSQAETSRMVAALQASPPQAPAAAVAPAASTTAVTPANSSAPAPGAVVIKFGFDSSVLEQEEANKLGSIVTTLKAEPKSKVQLRGYADKKGSTSYNFGLSQARAMSVQDTLRLAGVETSRVEILPLGSFSAADGVKSEDLRKVEVILVK